MATATKSKAPAIAVEQRVVSRPFDGAGAERVAGEIVNIATSAWRNAGYLEELRYLRPLAAGLEPVGCTHKGCDRQFIDQASLAVHKPQHDRPKAVKPPKRRPEPAAVAEE
jgi:hypothetical protein